MTVVSSEPNLSKTKLTADEIGLRVIKLIGSLDSIEELTLQHIREVTGIELKYHEGRGGYFYGEELTQGWHYSLDWSESSSNRRKPELVFLFSNLEDSNAAMTPVCVMDFDHYSSMLRTVGLKGDAAYGKHRQVEFWEFYRPGGDLSVKIVISGEASKPREKVLHDCVRSIFIW